LNKLAIKTNSIMFPHCYKEVTMDLELHEHFEYWFAGGRGSLKTSFAFLYSIAKMMQLIKKGEIPHMIALRKVKDTIRQSIYNDVLWAMNILGVRHYWESKESPLMFTCGESTIIFGGCANQREYEKIKGIKFEKGYLRFAIFEEITEFFGYEEVLSIIQSLFRSGSEEGQALFTYNPPPSKSNWVNELIRQVVRDRFIHYSNYTQLPEELQQKYLGKIFLEKAKIIKEINPRMYAHMYMGEVVGEGIEIYPNVEIRTITDDELSTFTQLKRGLDFGHVHSTCYSGVYYDYKKDWVYIVEEVYSPGLTNQTLAMYIKEMAGRFPIRADNENPNLINELSILGLNLIKTRKGKGSREQGIKWLADRAKIIIDKRRTPSIAEDFTLYEFKKDKNGKIIKDFPLEPDGSASVRYALEDIIQSKQWTWVK
jgi:phage terminase large subunit